MSNAPADAAASDASEKPRRRSPRMFVLLAIVCVVAAVIVVPKAARAKRQAEQTKKVRDAGGVVQYDFQGAVAGEPRGPEWMRSVLGDEYFVTVNTVRLIGEGFTDQTIADLAPHLKGLETLELLEMESKSISTKSVEPLSQLKQLRGLRIYNSKMRESDKEVLQKNLSKTAVVVSERTRL